MGALLLFAVHGCSSQRHHRAPFVHMEGSSVNLRKGQIIDTKNASIISFDELIEKLGAHDLVFIGEIHDNPEHHLIQVQVLQALRARHGRLAVATEFFEKPRQPFIDRYLDGDIEEREFLDLVGWDKTWSFDYSLYRPLILETKYGGNTIYAINVPRDIVRKVARSGLESLTPEEKGHIAERIDLENRKHREYVRKAYKLHKHRDLDTFDFFYQAQCVWEDSMAENIASHMEGTGERIVVFSGNGHIIYKFGIPERTFKRTGTPFATLILQPATDKAATDPESADFIWFTGHCAGRSHFMRNSR